MGVGLSSVMIGLVRSMGYLHVRRGEIWIVCFVEVMIPGGVCGREQRGPVSILCLILWGGKLISEEDIGSLSEVTGIES